MGDSETQPPVYSTQQITSTIPLAKQKSPKKVAAGKAITEKTKKARKEQKKKKPRVKSSSQTNSLEKLKQPARLKPSLIHR